MKKFISLDLKKERKIGLSVYRVLISILIITSMIKMFNYSELFFGINGISEHSRYLDELSFTNLSFLGLMFDFFSSKQYLVLVIIFAIMFCFSVFKYFTGIILYFLIFNLQLRNGLILDGSDNVLIVCLPFIIFADSYNYLSLNKYFFNIKSNIQVSNILVLAFLFQICIIYFFSGIIKIRHEEWYSGLANFFIFQLNEFQGTKYNTLLANNEFFVKSSTYLTLIFEITFPLILLFSKYKYVWLTIGTFFHIGIWVFMKIDVFPWIMIISYSIFITDDEYKKFFIFNNFKLTTVQ